MIDTCKASHSPFLLKYSLSILHNNFWTKHTHNVDVQLVWSIDRIQTNLSQKLEIVMCWKYQQQCMKSEHNAHTPQAIMPRLHSISTWMKTITASCFIRYVYTAAFVSVVYFISYGIIHRAVSSDQKRKHWIILNEWYEEHVIWRTNESCMRN